MTSRIRVLVVEQDPLFAAGLRLLIDQHGTLTVVGVAASVEQAADLIRCFTPDVALVGRCLATPRALTALGNVRGSTVLVVVANAVDDELLSAAMAAGAAAVVDDVASTEDLLDTMVRAGEGENLFSPSLIADLMRRRAGQGRIRRADGRAGADLSPREREVLGLLVEGCDSKRIATRLGLSVDTARDYAQNILEKLGAHSRLEAVVRADRLGLINLVVIAVAIGLDNFALGQVLLA